jgi:hypothetical protein
VQPLINPIINTKATKLAAKARSFIPHSFKQIGSDCFASA